MPRPALTPKAAIERLGATSGEVRSAVLLDARGEVAAHAGEAPVRADHLGQLAQDLFAAADAAGARTGAEVVGRLEVSRPDGGVFGLRGHGSDGAPWTLVAVTAAGALSSLVLYDLRMAVRSIGEST